MSSSLGSDGPAELQLREQKALNSDLKARQTAKEKVLELNTAEEETGKDEKEKKTFGRTPDGTGMRLFSVQIVGSKKQLATKQDQVCN